MTHVGGGGDFNQARTRVTTDLFAPLCPSDNTSHPSYSASFGEAADMAAITKNTAPVYHRPWREVPFSTEHS